MGFGEGILTLIGIIPLQPPAYYKTKLKMGSNELPKEEALNYLKGNTVFVRIDDGRFSCGKLKYDKKLDQYSIKDPIHDETIVITPQNLERISLLN